MRAALAGMAFLCAVGVLQSANAGRIWSGPGGGMTFALAVDPSRPGTVYAGTGRGGIFESTNAGKNWRRLTRSRRPARIRALAVDGAGTLYLSDADGKLLESTDRGASWRRGDRDADKSEVSSLAIDRRTKTVYAGTSAGVVRRSVDGGRTWSGSGAGLEGQAVLALAIDRRRRRGFVWAGTTGGVFRSTDGGVNWSKVNALPVHKLVVDPTRRRTLFAAREGVFRSTDGGRTWRRIPAIRHALSLAVDASRRPGAVYVGTSYESVLKSTDGGDTWAAANAGLYRLAEVIDLAIDARTKPSTLYAATSGLGVHRSTDGGASWLGDEGSAVPVQTGLSTTPSQASSVTRVTSEPSRRR